MDEMEVLYEGQFLAEEEAKEALLALLLADDGFATTVVQTIMPRDEKGPAPLSFAQERLWFLDQLLPGLSAYNIPVALHINGPLQITALSQSLNEIVRRHETLRTTFEMLDDQAIQVIAPTLHVGPALIDLRTLPFDVKENTVAHVTTQEARLPFDLARGPLLRASLLQLDTQEFLLLLTMHHIVSDGWSMNLLYQELAAFYAAFSGGKSSPLAPPTIQYADFAFWQRTWLQKEALGEHLDYWRLQLKNVPPILNLSTDRPRPAIQTFSGDVTSLILPTMLTTALKTLSQREEVTLFMTLLATWQTLLWRYTEQDDICVGTFIAGRNHAETEGLIGFFINNLVLRTDLSGNPTFREALERVRKVTLGAYAHQDVPFEKLLQELEWKHDLSTTPIFQVMLILQNMPEPIPELSGLSIHATGEWSTRANFDLALWVTETQERLHMSLQYNTDLFDAQTIQRMLNHLHILLQGIVDDPQQRLSALPLLSAAERQQLQWQAINKEYPRELCLHQLFEEQVRRTPYSVALVYEQEYVTYAALNQRANQLGYFLRRLGVGPETRVGICMPRCSALIVGLLGILKAGGAYVPLDPTYPQERLSLMVEDAQPGMLLTQTSLLKNFSAYPGRVICLDADWPTIDCEISSDLQNTTTPLNLAYIMYTSGSTGRPKGVAIQHHAVVNFIEAVRSAYALAPGDRILQFTSISFDISVEEIYTAFASGATLVLRSDAMLSSIPFFLSLCQQWCITVLDLPTAFWHEMVVDLAAAEQRLPSTLRLVIIGGERAQPERLAAWLQHTPSHIRLVNTYGPTETTVVATMHIIETTPPVGHDVPIGRALTNVRIAILDPFQQLIPIGVWGELAIGGEGLARGYLGYPTLTAEKFIPDPFGEGARLYRSGDRARYLPDGTIEFGGRLDDQVKLHGFRVEPGEIETALQLHPGIAATVVCAHEERPGEKLLVAYVVWKDAPLSTANELRPYLKTLLPEHMIPATFVFLERLPLLPNGKVDHRALPSPGSISAQSQASLIAPRDALELQLTQIWEECFHVHPIGVTDNFFEIGGHSLLAVRLLSQIQKRFSRHLPLSALFQGATIEQLATLLRQQPGTYSGSVLVGIQPQGNRRPLFLIHPTGGNVLCYVGLAHQLGVDQPVYGLQAQGLDGDEVPLTRIEDMATIYIKAIRSRQPEGPYLLGGWSSGGLVAFEMALQLQAQGQPVGLLVLLDTPAIFAREPETGAGASSATVSDEAAVLARFVSQLGENSGQDLAVSYADLHQLTPEDQILYVLEQAKTARIVPADADSSLISRLIRVYKADVHATLAYQPRVYPERIVYFQCEQSTHTGQDTIQAWRRIVVGGLDLSVSPGDHFGMLKEPHAQVLAARLRNCLAHVVE